MSSSKGTLAVWVSCLFSTLKHWSELLVQTSGLKFLPGVALSIWSWCLRQLLFQHTSVYLEWGCCHWWTMPSLHPSEQSCRGPSVKLRVRQQGSWKVNLGHSRREAGNESFWLNFNQGVFAVLICKWCVGGAASPIGDTLAIGHWPYWPISGPWVWVCILQV